MPEILQIYMSLYSKYFLSSLYPFSVERPEMLTSQTSSTGDMTRSVDECGLFRHFTFYDTPSTHPNDFVEFPLDKPLSLEVGNDGIIGRRVSLFSQPSSGVSKVVAEGIVGFNFISQATSPEPSSPVPSL